MLDVVRTTTFTGTSKVGDVATKMFTATINTETPEEMALNHWVVNYPLYRSNRTVIGAEEVEFEDMAYAFQAQLIKEKNDQVTPV